MYVCFAPKPDKKQIVSVYPLSADTVAIYWMLTLAKSTMGMPLRSMASCSSNGRQSHLREDIQPRLVRAAVEEHPHRRDEQEEGADMPTLIPDVAAFERGLAGLPAVKHPASRPPR